MKKLQLPENIEVDKKASVALPASGCGIPETSLKIGKTFAQFMEENAGLSRLIDTRKRNL